MSMVELVVDIVLFLVKAVQPVDPIVFASAEMIDGQNVDTTLEFSKYNAIGKFLGGLQACVSKPEGTT